MIGIEQLRLEDAEKAVKKLTVDELDQVLCRVGYHRYMEQWLKRIDKTLLDVLEYQKRLAALAGEDKAVAKMVEKKYLSIKDMARRYDVSTKTIRRWADAGKVAKPDTSRGAWRWWRPMVEEHDRQRRKAAEAALLDM